MSEVVKEAVLKKDDAELWNLIFEDRVLEMKVRKAYERLVRLCHAGKSRRLKRKY